MSKKDSREAYRKTGKERKRRDENKDTRSGTAMEDNSINSRSLKSHNNDAYGENANRAVSFQHAQDNMANSRVLQGVEGEGTNRNSERAVAPGHQKDNSTNSRVLLSHNNNAYGEDARRAVSFQHLQDNAANQRVVASHTPAPDVDPDSDNYAKGGGATRGVDTNNIVPWAIKPQHVEDGTMTWVKMRDKAPANKIPDLTDLNGNLGAGRITTGTFGDGRIPALGPGKIEVGRRGGGKINAQEAYLKTDINEGFTGGHGNDHHNPRFAAENHKHSIAFYNTPLVQMKAILDNRAWLRNEWDDATTTQKLDTLKDVVLQMLHLQIDQPDETGEQVYAHIAEDPNYRAAIVSKQTVEQADDDYYYLHPGPDDGGGTPGPKPMGVRRDNNVYTLNDLAPYTVQEMA